MMAASAGVAVRVVAGMAVSITAAVTPYTAAMAERANLAWRRQCFRPGERVAVALSGGADSVALLLALAAARQAEGLVLSAIHVHHGLRGAEADADARFVRELAARLECPLRVEHGDVPAMAAQRGQGTEEAARALRYGIFRRLLQAGELDAVATAHTLDDQAETVLMKLLRGAWTEGLGGIAPVVEVPGGRIVRPLLAVTRGEVLVYLEAAGQTWREDKTNAELVYTRNRVRHTLLPLLEEFNPQVRVQMARLAAVARDEEAWWQGELARVLPAVLLPGRATRGGGRASSTHPEQSSVAMEVERLRAMHPALQRRVLRAAAGQLGVSLPADAVESLLSMTGPEARKSSGTNAGTANGGSSTAKSRGVLTLPGGLRAERTPRELRLSLVIEDPSDTAAAVYTLPVPGSVVASEYGVEVTAEVAETTEPHSAIEVRRWRPGDRVTLRYGRGAKKVAEVLDRLRVYGKDRENWTVVARGARVLWMRGAEVDPAVLESEGLRLSIARIESAPAPADVKS